MRAGEKEGRRRREARALRGRVGLWGGGTKEWFGIKVFGRGAPRLEGEQGWGVICNPPFDCISRALQRPAELQRVTENEILGNMYSSN